MEKEEEKLALLLGKAGLSQHFSAFVREMVFKCIMIVIPVSVMGAGNLGCHYRISQMAETSSPGHA